MVAKLARSPLLLVLPLELLATVHLGYVKLGDAAPCDILGGASPPTPCVAAHSTTRALYSAYAGALYQVRRVSDKRAMDIKVTTAGGFADSAAQDKFCGASACHIWMIYDQSPRRNHLHIAPPGGNHKEEDAPVNATKETLTVGGHRVYAAVFEGSMGYRRDNTTGVATGDDEETIYMVAKGTHFNSECCFDYGNAETNNNDDGRGTMEAVSLSTHNDRGSGIGKGPWILADLEDGMWSASEQPGHAKSIQHAYVTAMLKGGSASKIHPNGHFAIKGGDSQAGELTVYYEGSRPKGYSPMKKQGSIILGIGGDNSDRGIGTFKVTLHYRICTLAQVLITSGTCVWQRYLL